MDPPPARDERLPLAVGLLSLLAGIGLLVAGALLLREASGVAVAGAAASPSPLLAFTVDSVVVPLLRVTGDPDPSPPVVAGWLRATLWGSIGSGVALLLLAISLLGRRRGSLTAPRGGP